MTYTLLKDLPYLKAGAEYVKCSNLGEGNFYMPNVSGMKHETFFIHKDWVENNFDWFEPKQWEPEVGEEYWVINFDNSKGKFFDVVVESNIMKETTVACWLPFFQTKEQAEKARLRVLEALKKAHE